MGDLPSMRSGGVSYPASAPIGDLPSMRSGGGSRKSRSNADTEMQCPPCGTAVKNDGRKCTICAKSDCDPDPVDPSQTRVFGTGVRHPKLLTWQSNQCFYCARLFVASMLKIGLCFK